MSKKYFRTTFQIEVLSEKPGARGEDLEAIAYAITEGDCSGVVEQLTSEELSPSEMRNALKKQGSDPSFFDL